HLLLEEHAATGRISLRAFYERRARRLLPALLVLLALYVPVAAALGEHPWAPAATGLFYCMNLVLAFGHLGATPLGGLWSLAAEDDLSLRVLGTGPLAYLGAISYALYLWHPIAIRRPWHRQQPHRAQPRRDRDRARVGRGHDQHSLHRGGVSPAAAPAGISF